MEVSSTGPGRIRLVARALAVAGCLAISVSQVRALTDEEIFRGFPYSFITPGPRALALGGAFVGLADDATAVFANPAGLYVHSASHLLVEYRSIRPDTADPLQVSLGSLAVDPVTGARDLPFLMLTSAPQPEDVGTFDFLGYVYPIALGKAGRRLSLAGSRQVVLSEDRTLPSSGNTSMVQFSFDSYPNTVENGEVVAYSVTTPVTGQSSTEIVYWNATASYEFHPDFSLGLTVSFATLDIDASTTTQVIDPLGLYVEPGHPRLPADPNSDIYQTGIDGSDSGFGYTVGIHWHPRSAFPKGEAPFALGARFSKGASLAVTETTVLNGVPHSTFSNEIVVPDTFALGGVVRFARHWLAVLEVERVQYSDQLAGYRSGANYFTSGFIDDGVSFPVDPNASITYTVDDGTGLRGGVEYVLPLGSGSGRELALRGGFYTAPDHQVRMEQFNSTDQEVNQMYLDAFPGGEDVNHVTLGLGLRLEASQLHLTWDGSDTGSQIAAGYSVSWGKGK